MGHEHEGHCDPWHVGMQLSSDDFCREGLLLAVPAAAVSGARPSVLMGLLHCSSGDSSSNSSNMYQLVVPAEAVVLL